MWFRCAILAIASVVSLGVSVAFGKANAQSCPALPNAKTSFGDYLKSLVRRSSSPSLSGMADPVKQLNKSQQQKVLGWLRDELEGRRAAVAGVRQSDEARAKYKALMRRIFTRDKIERDPILQRLRIFDRADGRVRVSTGRPKPLGSIVDEELARIKPSLAAKYAEKYRVALAVAVTKDAAKVGETLGALSGGDYRTVMDHAADWGAAGFGVIMGDVLEELGEERAKQWWAKTVSHAGTARTALVAINQGRPEVAWAAVAKAWKEEVKTQTKTAIKATINWVFDAGSGPAKLGDFVPLSATAQGAIAPGVFSISPGDIYLKLLEAEMAFLKWSKTYARDQADAPCIQKYVDVYKAKNGSISQAYKEFDLCIVTRPPLKRYSALWEFRNTSKKLGLTYEVAIRKFLEAHRKGELYADRPMGWMAAQIKAKKKKMERLVLPKLTRAERVMANVARAAGRAADNRLRQLAVAMLNDRQWQKLADDIRELEKALDSTMAAVAKDLDRLRKNSTGIAEACSAYDRQKIVARRALTEVRELSVESMRVWQDLSGVDVAGCKESPYAAKIQEIERQNGSQLGDLSSAETQVSSLVRRVCSLTQTLKNARNKDSARKILDEGITKVRDVRQIRIYAKDIAQAIAAATAKAKALADAQNADERNDVRARLDALARRIDTLAGRFANVRDQAFAPAKNAMRAAWRRVYYLNEPTEELINKVKTCLRPLAKAPVAAGPRRVLKELSTASTNNVGCKAEVNRSWTERDLDPSSGPGQPRFSAAWSRRRAELTYDPGRLRAMLTKLRNQCPAAAPTALAEPVQKHMKEAEAIMARIDEAVTRGDRCVATTLVAFRDAWLSRPDPQVAAQAFEKECQARFGNRFLGVMTRDGKLTCRKCKPGYIAKDKRCRASRETAKANCKSKYGNRFLRLVPKNGGFSCRYCREGHLPFANKCKATPATMLDKCRTKYGARFVRVDGTFGNLSCRFCREGYLPLSGKCKATRTTMEEKCRAKYGGQFLQVVGEFGRYRCRYCRPGRKVSNGRCISERAAAEARCRSRHGNRFLRVEWQNNQYVCRYCNPGYVPRGGRCRTTYRQSVANCRAKYGQRLLRVERHGAEYLCRYCYPGTVARGGRCYRVGGPAIVPQPGGQVRVGTCNSTVKQGGNRAETIVVNLGNFAGRASFSYNMLRIKDRMVVYMGGRPIIDTGCVSGSRTIHVNVPRGARQLRVIVQPNCQRRSNTRWSFRFRCPG